MLNHFIINYLISGFQLVVLTYAIKEYNTESDTKLVLFHIIVGTVIFSSFIYNLIQGIIKQNNEENN